jgi:hypothetical protein
MLPRCSAVRCFVFGCAVTDVGWYPSPSPELQMVTEPVSPLASRAMTTAMACPPPRGSSHPQSQITCKTGGIGCIEAMRNRFGTHVVPGRQGVERLVVTPKGCHQVLGARVATRCAAHDANCPSPGKLICQFNCLMCRRRIVREQAESRRVESACVRGHCMHTKAALERCSTNVRVGKETSPRGGPPERGRH